jgi:hypothetical protein
MTSVNDQVIPADRSVAVEPHGMLEAFSEIQQYYIIERSGTDVPKDFLTVKGTLAFFLVGLKTTAFVGIITSLMSPLAFAVFERLVPVYGNFHPSILDQAIVFFLPLSFTAVYSFMLASLGNYYIGTLTRAAIRSLFHGIISGAVVKILFIFLFFHYLFIDVFTTHRIWSLISKLTFVANYSTKEQIYYWIMSLKSTLIPTAWFFIISTLFYVTIPMLFILFRGRTLRKIIEEEKEWGQAEL